MKTQSRLQFLISLILCALFCAVIAVSAQLIIPGVIPFTMQTFAVFLTVAVLGTAWGSVSVLAYLCLGLIGAPVFAGFHGGIGVLFGATGGYLIGFLPAAPLFLHVGRAGAGLSVRYRLVCTGLHTADRSERSLVCAGQVRVSLHPAGCRQALSCGTPGRQTAKACAQKMKF